MIDTHHPELFYQDSPFLPIITNSDIDEVLVVLRSQKMPLINALCLQAGYIGEAINLLHESHLNWITISFQCRPEDLLLFYIGFTTPIQITLSAVQMNYATTKSVIQNLNLPTRYKLMQRHNQYKVGLLHDVHHIVTNKPEYKLNSVFSHILSLLRQRPFNRSKYYQAGIDAGIFTLQILFQKYQTKTNPTSN